MDSSMSKKIFYPVLIIILFSFIFQVFLIYTLPFRPPTDSDANDQTEYHTYGLRIAAGENYYDFGMRPPVYPYFLGTLYEVTSDLRLIRLIQVFGHLGLSVAMYLVASRLFGQRSGLISLGLIAFYPGLIYANLIIISDSIFNTLVGLGFLGGILLLTNLRSPPSRSWIFVAAWAALLGLIYALGYMTRSAAIFLPIALGLTLLLARPKNWILSSGVMSIAFLLTIMPMLWNTHQARGYWGSTENYFVAGLKAGNNSSDNIIFVWKGGSGDPAIQESKTICSDSQRPYLAFSDCTGSVKRALVEEIKQRPLLAFLRLFGKAIDLWGPERSFAGDVLDGDFGPASFQWMIFVALTANFFYVIVLVGGLTGMWAQRQRREIVWFAVLILLLTTVGISLMAYGHPRYHKPLMSILILFAGPGFSWLYEKYKHHKIRLLK
jgi:4-amino-4-deoxy-L-arabinose transferase-like glycosyltransferase